MIKKHFLDENKDSDENGIINVNCSPRCLSVSGFPSGYLQERTAITEYDGMPGKKELNVMIR